MGGTRERGQCGLISRDMWAASIASWFLLLSGAAAAANPTFAFTYTSKAQDWTTQTSDYEAVYVYAGDVELWCRGSPTATSAGKGSQTSTSLPCHFEAGPKQNAFVYYSSFARSAAAKYKAAGKSVYLNFDGRIAPKSLSYLPNFKLLTTSEVTQLAAAIGDLVCNDENVDGMGWDVEPFNNNQLGFFTALDARLTACGKRWGVFAFGEDFSDSMWRYGLGSSGFLLDSMYDLDCSKAQLPETGCQACHCTPPAVYAEVLVPHVHAVMAKARLHQKPYRLMVSGSASTQLYESLSDESCSSAGDGGMYNASCPYTMSDWMLEVIQVLESARVRDDPLFEGLAVYGYSSARDGGFEPIVPPPTVFRC